MHHCNKLFTAPHVLGFKFSLSKDFDKEERTVFFPLTAANGKASHLGVAGHIYGNGESSCNIYGSYRSA